MNGQDLAEAAERMIGCRFRLHGRDAATGLDCIGLLAASLRKIGRPGDFPNGYRLRTGQWNDMPRLARDHGFAEASGETMPGDVVFVRPGPAQLHLLIAATRREWFIEAHAGLGRVVLRPGPPDGILVQRWRMTAQA